MHLPGKTACASLRNSTALFKQGELENTALWPAAVNQGSKAASVDATGARTRAIYPCAINTRKRVAGLPIRVVAFHLGTCALFAFPHLIAITVITTRTVALDTCNITARTINSRNSRQRHSNDQQGEFRFHFVPFCSGLCFRLCFRFTAIPQGRKSDDFLSVCEGIAPLVAKGDLEFLQDRAPAVVAMGSPSDSAVPQFHKNPGK